jgi:hypothetical protein
MTNHREVPQVQQPKSAIDKLLDMEFARRDPEPLHDIADIGLRGISAIDDGIYGLRNKLVVTMSAGARFTALPLRHAQALIDRAFIAMCPADYRGPVGLRHPDEQESG